MASLPARGRFGELAWAVGLYLGGAAALALVGALVRLGLALLR